MDLTNLSVRDFNHVVKESLEVIYKYNLQDHLTPLIFELIDDTKKAELQQ